MVGVSPRQNRTGAGNKMDKPIWDPGKERVDHANLSRFMRFAREHHPHADFHDYRALYDFSIRSPGKFWQLVWDFCGIKASGDHERVLVEADTMQNARWFPDVRLNFAQNLLRFSDDRTALLFRGENGNAQEFSYAQLHAHVGALTAALKERGVGIGDCIAGFLPNLPAAVIAMLATASLGAVWSSYSPDLAIDDVLDRLGRIEPKLLFCADGYACGGKQFDSCENVRVILDRIGSIACVVVVPYLDPAPSCDGLRDAVLLPDFVAAHAGTAPEFVPTPFDHPLYAIHSTNADGVPSCVMHGSGGTLLEHLKELVLHTDLRREDRIFQHTACDRTMWNWLVSSLAVGASIVLYDGDPMYPDASALWNLTDDCGISIFGVSVEWIDASAIAGAKPAETHKLSALRTILATGNSPLAPGSFDYVYRDVKDRVQLSLMQSNADMLSSFALGCPILPVWRGELQCRGLGMAVQVLDGDGTSLRDTIGEMACVAPFPSMPIGFWNDADGSQFRGAYFERQPGVWCSGIRARLTEHDGVIIHAGLDSQLVSADAGVAAAAH